MLDTDATHTDATHNITFSSFINKRKHNNSPVVLVTSYIETDSPTMDSFRKLKAVGEASTLRKSEGTQQSIWNDVDIANNNHHGNCGGKDKTSGCNLGLSAATEPYGYRTAPNITNKFQIWYIVCNNRSKRRAGVRREEGLSIIT